MTTATAAAPAEDTSTTQTVRGASSSVDMLDPADTCTALKISESELCGLVNRSELAAYDLGGQIRFRYCDVLAFEARAAIAA